MISESLARSRRLFWLGRSLLALGAILLPVVAYGLATLLVEGHAQKEYFEAVSQILPVLLLALAIEQRYLRAAKRCRTCLRSSSSARPRWRASLAGTPERRGSTR